MKLAAVLVHYHTPELLEAATEALRRDADAAGIELEALVVDNGSRPQDREILESLPFKCLTPGRNLGYAGGVNPGLQPTQPDAVIVVNPDVLVLPGRLAALSEALRDGADAAGPRFYWDPQQRFLLPPTEAVNRRTQVLRVLAERDERWAGPGRRAWRRHARRHWQAQDAFSSFDLSGALLAVRRSAWHRIGPFDEDYRLYFEETDWLQRLRAAGREARCVPAAEAIHLYDQSTRYESRAGTWFLESNRRFRRRTFGRAFTAALEFLSSPPKTPATASDHRAESRESEPRDAPAWLEVSASPIGYPAAGHQLNVAELPLPGDPRSWLSEEIWQRLAPGTYFLRTVDAAGRDCGLRSIDKHGHSRETWVAGP